MKIYFDFGMGQRSLLCHELAKCWKKNYGINDFAGMIVVKNGGHLDFLKNQKEINYHFIDNRDTIEEEALKIKLDMNRMDEIEKKLDIPLWYFVVADRNMGHFFVKGAIFSKTRMMSLANHENIMKWVVYYYDLLDRRLDEFKPDAVVFLSNASLPSLMLAKMCEIKNIPYYELVTSRIKNFYSIIKNSYKGINKNIIEDYKSILSSEKPSEVVSRSASDYVDSFKKNPVSPEEDSYVLKDSRRLARQGIIKIIGQTALECAKMIATNIVFNFDKRKNNSYLRKKKILSSTLVNMRKKLVLRNSMQDLFDNNINSGEKYVFYPLHLDPEASTMILSPNFVNQLNLIEILAKNVPMTHKLYIKEHVPNIGIRPSNFYEEIKKYPNVRLVNPWANTFDLISNSSLVVTISGTAGFEATLMRKPAIVFSETFYSKAGLAEYCSDIDRLGEVIKRQIYESQETSGEERDLKIKALVTAIYKNSFKVNAADLIWGGDKKDLAERKDDLNKVAEKFYQAFNKK
ncbi:MAG: hypothetical protein V1804_04240 [Patescibacteria group bacterium]